MNSVEGRPAQLCTGCAACEYVCPKGAITVKPDEFGFTVSSVDEDLCIGCGCCLSVCHFEHAKEFRADAAPAAYAAYNKDIRALANSASGGAAHCISQEFISEGGVVYGCAVVADKVQHIRVTDVEDLCLLQGSKYVQSDIAAIYSQIQKDLVSDRKVLFIGTPCQVAAVRSVFSTYAGLYVVDLVCEGVPNAQMFWDFISYLEQSMGRRIVDYRFRDKRNGWSSKCPTVVVEGENGSVPQKTSDEYYYYYYYFNRALILRDSCYACPYACLDRIGDITVGDFWGAESAGLGISVKTLSRGLSLVLVSSDKGRELYDSLAGSAWTKDASVEVAVRKNACLVAPSSCDFETRRALLESYRDGGTEALVESWYHLCPPHKRIVSRFVGALPFGFKTRLKQMAVLFTSKGRRRK